MTTRSEISERSEIANDLLDLASRMKWIALKLRPYSEENADQLLGASRMAFQWSIDILNDDS